MIAEVAGGLVTNSLALLSDAGHMLTDIAAVLLALLALWFSGRPVTPRKTYGYYRMEILAALANGVALVVISLVITYEAVERIRQPEPVRGLPMLVIAAGGLLINLVSAWLLQSASRDNLNVRAALLHVIGDALGSVCAIVAGVIILAFGWSLIDPIVSVAVCGLIIYSAWQIIRESVNILLEGAPSHINVRALIETIHRVESVIDVHDLHVWTISSGMEALSAHVTIVPGASHKATLNTLQERLRSEFNIGHLTLQLESAEEEDEDKARLYQIIPRSESEADATSTRGGRQSPAAGDCQD
jgi:cobalt-zinc-cadmium efflux system protein